MLFGSFPFRHLQFREPQCGGRHHHTADQMHLIGIKMLFLLMNVTDVTAVTRMHGRGSWVMKAVVEHTPMYIYYLCVTMFDLVD